MYCCLQKYSPTDSDDCRLFCRLHRPRPLDRNRSFQFIFTLLYRYSIQQYLRQIPPRFRYVVDKASTDQKSVNVGLVHHESKVRYSNIYLLALGIQIVLYNVTAFRRFTVRDSYCLFEWYIEKENHRQYQ